MMRNLFSKELAERLGVSIGTLHKKEFQQRLGLPIGKIGRKIFSPEPAFNAWVLEKAGVGSDAQAE
jgi:hypothetical protein